MPRVSEMMPAQSITPTTGAWAALDSETQAWLEEIAGNVMLLLARGKADDAVDEIDSHDLAPEMQVAIWTQFSSSERRVLKAVVAARREKAKP